MVKSTRKFNKKRRFGSRKNPSTFKVNRKVKRLSNKINDMVELKYYDTIRGSIAVPQEISNDGSNVYLLNDIPDISGISGGESVNFRVGSECIITSVRMGIRMVGSEQVIVGDFAEGCQIRMILYWDKQYNNAGGSPISMSVTGSGNTSALLDDTIVTDVINAPYNYTASERYKVLFDKVYDLNAPFAAAILSGPPAVVSSPFGVVRHFHKKIKVGKRTKFSSDTSGFIGTGALIVGFISDKTIVTGPPLQDARPTLSYGARVFFKDA